MFVVTVNFRVKPGHVDAFADAMAAQARNSLDREAGCRRFDVCRDAADPALIFLYEIYDDEAAFKAHLESTHFKDFDARVAEWTAEKTVETWVLQQPGD